MTPEEYAAKFAEPGHPDQRADIIALIGANRLSEGYCTYVKGGSAAVGVTQTAVSAVPVVGGILSGIIGIFTQHHINAVKNENAVLCQVTAAYNKWASETETALVNGSISLEQAQQDAQTFLTQLQGVLAPLFSGGQKNAGYGTARNYLPAMIAYNMEVRFPQLTKSTSLAGVLSNDTGKIALSGGVALLAILASVWRK